MANIPKHKAPIDVILDYNRLDEDFARAKSKGSEELQRFAALVHEQRKKWEHQASELSDYPWDQVPPGAGKDYAEAGKDFVGRLKTLQSRSAEGAEQIAAKAKEWKSTVEGGAQDIAEKAIKATEKGEEGAADEVQLDKWQETALEQARNSAQALLDYESKALDMATKLEATP